MSECAPIPCPSWETVTLEVTEVCDCRDHYGNGLGNPDCPIHGDRIRDVLSCHEVNEAYLP